MSDERILFAINLDLVLEVVGQSKITWEPIDDLTENYVCLLQISITAQSRVETLHSFITYEHVMYVTSQKKLTVCNVVCSG